MKTRVDQRYSFRCNRNWKAVPIYASQRGISFLSEPQNVQNWSLVDWIDGCRSIGLFLLPLYQGKDELGWILMVRCDASKHPNTHSPHRLLEFLAKMWCTHTLLPPIRVSDQIPLSSVMHFFPFFKTSSLTLTEFTNSNLLPCYDTHAHSMPQHNKANSKLKATSNMQYYARRRCNRMQCLPTISTLFLPFFMFCWMKSNQSHSPSSKISTWHAFALTLTWVYARKAIQKEMVVSLLTHDW